MLGDLMNGQEKSRFTLLTDGVECSGRHLLLNWIYSLGTRCDKVILVCFERPQDFYKAWLPQKVQEKLVCISGHGGTSSLGRDIYDICDASVSDVSHVGGEVGVIIDSLTHQIMLKSAPVTCSALRKLATGTGVVQLVSLLHKDCHDQQTCRLIEHLASSVVDVQHASGSCYTCHIRHCRTTGKVFKSKESFRFDESLHIKDIGPASPEGSISLSKPVIDTQMQDDPAAELSFNLVLTDSEKEARSKVKLPYLRDVSGDSDDVPSSGGRIIYQPDDADDFDEEDPDDDLNI